MYLPDGDLYRTPKNTPIKTESDVIVNKRRTVIMKLKKIKS